MRLKRWGGGDFPRPRYDSHAFRLPARDNRGALDSLASCALTNKAVHGSSPGATLESPSGRVFTDIREGAVDVVAGEGFLMTLPCVLFPHFVESFCVATRDSVFVFLQEFESVMHLGACTFR